MTQHRENLHEAFLNSFSLKVDGISVVNHDAIVKEINTLKGIDCVRILSESSLIKVTYDASLLSIDAILMVLEKHGVTLHFNWWNRIKLAWNRYIDENIKNNATSHPHCCNKPPVRIFRKR